MTDIKCIKVYERGFMLWHSYFALNLLSSAAVGQNRGYCVRVNQLSVAESPVPTIN